MLDLQFQRRLDLMPWDAYPFTFVPFNETHCLQHGNIIIDILVAPFKKLCERINTHRTGLVQFFQEHEPLGGDVAEQGLEIMKEDPLYGLFGKDALVELAKNFTHFSV